MFLFVSIKFNEIIQPNPAKSMEEQNIYEIIKMDLFSVLCPCDLNISNTVAFHNRPHITVNCIHCYSRLKHVLQCEPTYFQCNKNSKVQQQNIYSGHLLPPALCIFWDDGGVKSWWRCLNVTLLTCALSNFHLCSSWMILKQLDHFFV